MKANIMVYILHSALRDEYLRKRNFRKKYECDKYELFIHFDKCWLSAIARYSKHKIPVTATPFDSVTIKYRPNELKIFNYEKNKEKDFSENPGECVDIRHVGELIFLLAAKAKYDSYRKHNQYEFDFEKGVKCNFSKLLHTTEINRISQKWGMSYARQTRTKERKNNTEPPVFKQLFGKLKDAKIPSGAEWLLSEYGQIYDLVNIAGNYSGSATGWLFAFPNKIIFADSDSNIIEHNVLERALEVLFEEGLFDKDEAIKEYNCLGIVGKVKKITGTVSPQIDQRFNTFCNNIRSQALEHLGQKLHGENEDDYKHLDLEIGLFDEKDINQKNNEFNISDHNRNWKQISRDKLFNLQGRYVLTSDTGTGKTTFLRKLQIDIIDKKLGLLPIYLHIRDIDNFKLGINKYDSFLKNTAELFDGYIDGKSETDFLLKYQNSIIFLIDGLDQATEKHTARIDLSENILNNLSDKIILASRPFAITHLEQNKQLIFLRLKPFSPDIVEKYFGKKDYQTAINICKRCRKMPTIPMLAYMVRFLIKKNLIKDIKNRTDLYEIFIDYLFDPKHYKHDNLNVTRSHLRRIRQAYEKLSFEAIAYEPHHLKQIPFDFADDIVEGVDIDELLKLGLTQLFEKNIYDNKSILYFSHQSFQEYLAAVHISNDDELINKVLKEKWNPKWKEVLKFLVGIKGQDIIQSIYDEDDNIVHSKLLLAAELVPETYVDSTLQEAIYTRLLALPEFLKQKIERSLIYVYKSKAFHRLSNMLSATEDIEVVNDALDIIIKNRDIVGSDRILFENVIDLIGVVNNESLALAISSLSQSLPLDKQLLENIFKKIDKEKMQTLSILSTLDICNDSLAQKISTCITNKDPEVTSQAIYALKAQNIQDTKLLYKVAGKLDSPNEDVVVAAISCLGSIEINEDSILCRISNKIDDLISNKVISIIYPILKETGWHFDAIEKTIKALDHPDECFVKEVIYILKEMKIKDEAIVNKITSLIDNPNIDVINDVLLYFRDVGVHNNSITKKIVSKLDNKKHIFEILDTLGNMGAKNSFAIDQLIHMIEDEKNNFIIIEILLLLGKLNIRDKPFIDKILTMLDGEKDEILDALMVVESTKIQHNAIIKKIEAIIDSNSDCTCVANGILALRVLEISNKSVVNKIIGKLSDPREEVVIAAIYAIGNLKIREKKVLREIADKLIGCNESITKAALETLKYLKVRDNVIIKKIFSLLNSNQDSLVFHIAISTLAELDIQDDTVIQGLIEKLQNSNSKHICSSILLALVKLKDKLDDISIQRVVHLAGIEQSYGLLCELYQINKL